MNAEATQFEIERLQECCTQYRKGIARLTARNELLEAVYEVAVAYCVASTEDCEKALIQTVAAVQTTEQVENDG